ncbi:phenazine antibiotic biosynthesis protein [Sphaerisporangium melleum]|uniref:Phenazine antibiotic biosynthesis protein n=1 Tax=Sphaerisporangium melleum TaxID=321316 RepID=A0A917RFQ5_9ACTN|nr:phenazine biosynthesis protein [Sphaerisporangium melleum]GGL05093.1 phenazine antibiotic biosynthesis protein [Sphaerisporangium melleum]GII73936.1 phenazine antibiotic biosynthesis protein [Sphaerisporangium melleum]
MSDDFATVFEAPVDQVPDLDELVVATMTWHFSPSTGSPFWTGRAASFGFDPLSDVKTYDDLLECFSTVEVDWSAIPAHTLIPRGSAGRPGRFGVYESGGTTGAPKRIVDATSRRRNIEYQSMFLDEQGFPTGGLEAGWLHVGPTGPHIMAKNIGNLTELRGFLSYFVDLDPRWVKRCIATGREDESNRYIDHILDQVKDVLQSQDIRAMSSTPRILERIVARPDVYEPLREKVRGIIWGGTSVDAETLNLLENEAFPEATIAGAYGNTMMGMAPQRTRRDGDPSPCVFRPFYPYTIVDVVDPVDLTTRVPVDTRGVVKITALTRDLFMPPTVERDMVTLRAPLDGHPGVEVSDVRPNETAKETIIEGVY